MKNLKLIAAISCMLILSLGNNPVSAQANFRNGTRIDKKGKQIAYVVRVENNNYAQNDNSKHLIIMTDGSGNQVALSQLFRPGVSEYIFFEAGPVTGTREARMMKLPMGPHSNDIPPCSRTGIFLGGASYLFVLKPIPAATDNSIVHE
jgi:hypothetical protein